MAKKNKKSDHPATLQEMPTVGESLKARPLPPPVYAKRKNHACFAGRDGKGDWEALGPTEMARAEVEFYGDDDGKYLYRIPLGVVGESSQTICVTGAFQVAQACSKIGCKPPEATVRRLAEEAERRSASRESSETVVVNQTGASAGKGKRKMKGKNGKSIVETWRELFDENEQRVKDGKKPWTDAQLTEKMEAIFPDAKGKSTMTRANMYRSCHNSGEHFYEKLGAAKVKSHRYDEKGERIEKHARAAKAEKAAKKPSGKKRAKADGKKKVVRKAAKK